MTGILKKQNGVALITTLGVVLVLLVAATQIARVAADAVKRTSAGTEQFMVREMAVSGIHIAMAVLAGDAQQGRTDTLRESWANPEKLAAWIAAVGVDPEELVIVIEDETSKIPVNALMREYPGNSVDVGVQSVLERFFRLSGDSGENENTLDATGVVNAVKDWLDSNDDNAITGLSGAESEYYESLNSPYPCANAPFNHVDEMRLVRGLDKENFGEEIKNHFTVDGLSDNTNEIGRYTYFGKININTAPLEVLAALMPEGRDHLAQVLIDFREERALDDETVYRNRLEAGWETRVLDLSENEKNDLKRRIVYSSRIFTVTSTARKSSSKVTLSAVVERKETKGRWTCRILRMEHG